MCGFQTVWCGISGHVAASPASDNIVMSLRRMRMPGRSESIEYSTPRRRRSTTASGSVDSRMSLSSRVISSSALEESLSTVLVKRERPVAAKHAGEVLLRHVKALPILEGSALQELGPTAKPHAPVSLAIAVNADSLATWFPEVLRELLMGQLVALVHQHARFGT